jgi:hypothetical protein
MAPVREHLGSTRELARDTRLSLTLELSQSSILTAPSPQRDDDKHLGPGFVAEFLRCRKRSVW